MMMSPNRPSPNRVKEFRQQHGWSQDQLSEKAGISRAAVSAIEIRRLVPSVAAALALARVFDCSVEDLFGCDRKSTDPESWVWSPPRDPCRFWRANVGGHDVRIPVENTVAGMLPHDGVWRQGRARIIREAHPEKTLVMASCDPAAGLLALEYERATGLRLIPLQRSSRAALDLLQRGAVHVAGIHLAAADNEIVNARAAKAVLGSGFALLRFATWDEGLAVHPAVSKSSVNALMRANLRWIGREAGAGARQCQDEILGHRPGPRRLAKDHHSVAEAIRCGLADVGVCLRLVSDQAGLRFIHVRDEAYDLCFPESLASDIRLKKLLDVVRSPGLKAQFASLPGYGLSRTLEPRPI
jgi:molybdate-binding protein/transcriptional regulator with XRE-family HTH domain